MSHVISPVLLVARQVLDNATGTDAPTATTRPVCGGGGLDPNAQFNIGLHIGALFIIFATSSLGAFFPVLSKRVPALKIPDAAFIIAKFFGSGVIIATAFIHMLPSAFESLTDPCLPDFWTSTYTAAPGAITMTSAILIFLIEYGSTRYLANVDRKVLQETSATESVNTDPGLLEAGNEGKLQQIDNGRNAHLGHHHLTPAPVGGEEIDPHTAATQKLGVAILETGIIFHSVFIGLTLAVSTGSDFVSLFITIIFHRSVPALMNTLLTAETFEGLALGSRIATLSFHRRDWRPWVMALAYSCTTPLGIAIGLGVRLSYDPNSERALISAGVFDAVSAGLLIYAGMVELLAHDFIHGEMRTAPRKIVYLAIGAMLVGCALMSLLGRWA